MGRTLAALGIVAMMLGCGSEDSSVGPDREPPRVVSLTPADGATAVPLDARIEARFSELVVFDSLGPSPLRVEGTAGSVSGTTSIDATGTLLSFVADDSLSSAADYRVVVAAGLSDLAGNAQRDSVESHFTTALQFYAVGRIFVASLNSRDVRAFDVRTYAPVPGSPVALGLRPIRLRVVAETSEVWVLYLIPPGAGVLVLDAMTLAVLRDSGNVLPADVTDVAVSPTDGRAFVSAPESNAVQVLDAATLTEAGNPIVFPRTGSDPSRVTVARRRRLLLVGLEGAGQIAAFNLPSLTPAAGFPVAAVRQIHTITLDEDRNRAWVGGGQRYAIVDLLNPARSVSFQIPNLPGCLAPLCTPRAWSMTLSPPYDRAYFLNRVDFISSARIADLSVIDENWGRLGGIEADVVQNPRSGELVILEARSVGAGLFRVDPLSLFEVDAPRIEGAGDGPINMAVLP
jgi:hypothetical protein